MTAQMPINETEKPKYAVHDSVFAWLCILLGYLFCRAIPVSDSPMGMFLVVLIAVISTIVILVIKNALKSYLSLIFAISSILFAFSPVITASGRYEDISISFLSVLASVFCFSFFVYKASGNGLEKGFSDFVMVDFLVSAFKFPLESMGAVFKAMFPNKSKGTKRVFKVIIGLVIGLVPTVIIASLLEYDSAFNQIMNKIWNYIENINVFSHLVSLWFGCIIGMYIFGLVASASSKYEPKTTVESCRQKASKLRILPLLTAFAALIPLVAVYSIFFISQIDYYVSAFKGVLPEGISYADYAREGFFELCTVSGINMVVLVLISVLTKSDQKIQKIFLKISSILLSLITLVLITTAMSKMVLYIKTFGLTPKRVLSSWFMILLALIFVLIIIKQIFPEIKLVASSFAVGFIMFLGLSLSNYMGIIADYNVDRYIQGKAEAMDVTTLNEMGVAAVPAMVRLKEYWDANPDKTSDVPRNYLNNTLESYKMKLETSDSFTGFSIPNHRAKSSLSSRD